MFFFHPKYHGSNRTTVVKQDQHQHQQQRPLQASTESESDARSILKPSAPLPSSPKIKLGSYPYLLSNNYTNVVVSSSALGNLGPPSVILLESDSSWLEDRWQAAKDMSGKPLPGPHFLLMKWVDQPLHKISRIMIDFETAHCDDYYIEISQEGTASASTIFDTKKDAAGTSRSRNTSKKQHVIDDIKIDRGAQQQQLQSFNIVKINFRKPSSEWGTSVWNVKVYGNFL